MFVLRIALAALFGVNGLAMLCSPAHWFAAVPGVQDTGPFNPHFVRDVGAAYLLGGLAFAALALRPRAARPYALAAVAFLLAHGALHLAEAVFGLESLAHLLTDLPAVLALPALAAFSAWRAPRMS